MLAFFELVAGFFGMVFCALGVLGTVFWIWMLVECATREPNTGTEKIVWVLIIIFTHWIGAAIYYFVRRPKRITEVGR